MGVGRGGGGLVAHAAPAGVPPRRNKYPAPRTLDKPTLDAEVRLLSLRLPLRLAGVFRRAPAPVALAVALGTTVVFALAPAVVTSRVDLTGALKEDDRTGQRGRALSVLVVGEIALACLLLTGSGLLLETFARIQSRRTGFVADDVLTFWVRPPGSRYPP